MNELRQLLESLGYADEYLRIETHVNVSNRRRHVDFLGYGRPVGPHDASTATLVAWVGSELALDHERAEIGQSALQLGAPAAIEARADAWTLYSVTPRATLEEIETYLWNDDTNSIRAFLGPAELLSIKLGHRQLALFPVAAQVSRVGRSVREGSLGPIVADALRAASDEELRTVLDGESAELTEIEAQTRAARMVIGALTAAVLRDKEPREGPTAITSDVILNRAVVLHPDQYSWLQNAPIAERELVQRLIAEFSELDYTNFEPSLLSNLYETLLVGEARRLQMGTHYTPSGLAHRLLQWMPIEDIPPEHRTIYDPTCGSGTLLVAAHDRLRNLQSETLTATTSHSQLVASVRGADNDPIAASIANLALFLNAMPAGNGWQIDLADVFAPNSLLSKSNILVCNPPWKHSNSEKHDDLAQRVFEKVVLAANPNAQVGFILPSSWLTRSSPSARRSRELAFTILDIFEIWRLPQGTFEGADLGATVLLGRKKLSANASTQKQLVVRRRVSKRAELNSFYETGTNHPFLQLSQPDLLGRGPLITWWMDTKPNVGKLNDLVDLRQGPQPESPAKLLLRSTSQPNIKMVEWRDVASFSSVAEAPYRSLAFPDDMQNGSSRGFEMLGRPKILMSGTKNPEMPWRLKVAIDRDGSRMPLNTVRAAFILDKISVHLREEQRVDLLDGLMAYLGSGFVSGWLDESKTTRHLSSDAMKNLPVPDLEILQNLAPIGRQLSESVTDGALANLEKVVWGWVDAPPQVENQVKTRLNEGVAPEGRLRYGEPIRDVAVAPMGVADAASLPRSGVVVEVSKSGVQLAIPGLTPDDGVFVTLPSRMPGALLRPGAGFIAMDDGGMLDALEFKFDEVSYLSDADVERDFLTLTNPGPSGIETPDSDD